MLFEKLAAKRDIRRSFAEVMGKKCIHIQMINKGFYGYVYLLKCEGSLRQVIAKLYKHQGYMDLEETQLNLLRSHALVTVPALYGKSYQLSGGAHDILFMEYINGVNASAIQVTSELEKERFCNQVIDNLLSIHQITNPAGFGSVTGEALVPSWEDCYKSQLDILYNQLKTKSFPHFSSASMALAESLYHNFQQVFSEPVGASTLIHGDYNLWNLIADPNTKNLIGMIDPMGCSFADKELELFQLENANGSDYGLLPCYAKQVSLSSNIALKNAYYHFWDDIKHMVNMGYCNNQLFACTGNQAMEYLK